ncbi:MAG: hypothetical protein ABFS38_08175 [Bacteroidota bacterium]
MSISEIQQTEQIWKNLEIAIMIIALLTPIIIALLVFRFNGIIKRLNKKQWTNQKIVEKRIEIYDRIVPKLNDILCFYSYTGNWKELTPIDIIRLKKELNKDINIYAPLFSDDLSKKYIDFIHLCFVSFSGWEHDEKIKSLYELRQEHNVEWNDDWIQFFDTNNVIEAIKIKERYNELIDSFKKDLVVFQSGHYPGSSAPK